MKSAFGANALISGGWKAQTDPMDGTGAVNTDLGPHLSVPDICKTLRIISERLYRYLAMI